MKAAPAVTDPLTTELAPSVTAASATILPVIMEPVPLVKPAVEQTFPTSTWEAAVVVMSKHDWATDEETTIKVNISNESILM